MQLWYGRSKVVLCSISSGSPEHLITMIQVMQIGCTEYGNIKSSFVYSFVSGTHLQQRSSRTPHSINFSHSVHRRRNPTEATQRLGDSLVLCRWCSLGLAIDMMLIRCHRPQNLSSESTRSITHQLAASLTVADPSAPQHHHPPPQPAASSCRTQTQAQAQAQATYPPHSH